MKLLILLAFIGMVASQTKEKPCKPRDFDKGGTVCVCDENYCDTMGKIEQQPKGSYAIYTSNKAGERHSKKIRHFGNSSESTAETLTLNRNIKYQQIFGFGGAFTDSTGINFGFLKKNAQEFWLKSYFSEEGIEYNMGRVPIGGTDFSTHGYSYADGEEDANLTSFALATEDAKYKIPLIKSAIALNKNMQLFASPWVAPKWMKTNGEYAGAGAIKPEYYQTWVNYFIKFLDAYKKHDISFWGITTGNEPSLAIFFFNPIPSVGWWPNDKINWISHYLGPTLRNSPYSDIKIMGLDDQRFLLPGVEIELNDNLTRSYIDGIGVHFYWDKITPASWLSGFHDKFPDKFILATEACRGSFLIEEHVSLGSWQRGEDYAIDIIEDLQNWVTGWIDWNMALDLEGGPTYISNFVDSPIIVNTTSGEFYKQPMYYTMGHFSKFLPRGSIRLHLDASNDNKLALVAFKRPDTSITIIILNKGNDLVLLNIKDANRGDMSLEITPKSINSIVYW